MEIMLKTVDACNNNCAYCFYFARKNRNLTNASSLTISQATVNETIKFINKGCNDLEVEELSIIFHGGEPMLQKTEEFNLMCEQFTKNISNNLILNLGIQTNGTLITKEWIKIFEKYHVSPSISIDGPREYNDHFRIDHKGTGTYEKIVFGLKLLQQSIVRGRIKKISTLTVIHPPHSAKKIYHHLVDELHLNEINFLFPDLNYDTFDIYAEKNKINIEQFSDYWCGLFDEWIKDPNRQNINIELFKEFGCFLDNHKHQHLIGFGLNKKDSQLPIFTIFWNGKLFPEDNFITMDPNFFSNDVSIFNTSLQNFVKLPFFKTLNSIKQNLPVVCQKCVWSKFCQGGRLVNRYSSLNKFANPSIYCSALKKIYHHIDSVIQQTIKQEKN